MCDNNNNKLENSIEDNNTSHQGLGLNDPLISQMQQHIVNAAVDAYDRLGDGRPGSSTLAGFPELSSQILPWNFPQLHHAFGPAREPDPFLFPPPPGLFGPRRPPGLQFGYEPGPSDHLRLISESLGQVVHPIGSAPFGLQAELQKMTAQEIMDAKALAASKSHSEAERRRRERINNHLAKLRSLLPSTTKTDKASLLAEVIQHVKELKRQTTVIAETSPVPTETDELSIDNVSPEEGRSVIKASICCEDRPDLLPELIGTLKALRLKTLRAEITTLGGRVKNVLFVTSDDADDESNDNIRDDDHEDDEQQQNKQLCISSIQEALKSVMEKTNNGDESGSGSVKRQRTNINIVEHRSL